MKNKALRCRACGRRQVVAGEGRWIDGSWTQDHRIRTRRPVWVCCYRCYSRLLAAAEGVDYAS